MDEPQAERLIKVDYDHVLVITGDYPPEMLGALAEARGCLVIDLGPNGKLDDVQALDEDAMRAAGWVRAPAA